MWQERIKRILIIIGAAVLVLLAGKVFADWQEKRQVAGESIKLPTEVITEKVGEVGEDILGKAVEILPGSNQLKERVVEKETQTKVIEVQTKEIMEIIKQLPQDQVEQIKKQIFKDFCEEVMRE